VDGLRFDGPPVVDSEGTSPRYALTACALLKRFGSSMTARNVAATIRPTPKVNCTTPNERISFRQQLKLVVDVNQLLLDEFEHGSECCA
jgi:hypothetical protein